MNVITTSIPRLIWLLGLPTDTKRTSQSSYNELAQALKTFVAEISTNDIPNEGFTIPLVINRKERLPGGRRKIELKSKFKLKILLQRMAKFQIKETKMPV
jgi:hypothetical protein